METSWETLLQSSREPFGIEQISSKAKMCSSMRGTSIHRVFQSNSPGFQVIVDDVTNGCRVMETRWDLVPK